MAAQALGNFRNAVHPEITVPVVGLSGDEGWDQFVEATPGGDLAQTTAWAQAKRALGFEVCQVISRRGQEIAGGAQIIIKRFGPLGAIGYISRGPLVRSTCPQQSALALAEIERAARAKQVRYLIIQPPEGGSHVIETLAARGYAEGAPAVAPTATLRIDLGRSLEQILAGMSASRRTRVRRCQREGVEVRIGDPDHLDLFYPLYEATSRRQGFRALSRPYLRHHWDALHCKGWAQLFFAFHEGEPLAAVWTTAFADTVTTRLFGWNGQGRRLQPNVAIEWHIIQWAKEQGFRFYDFGGIDRRYAELMLAERPLTDEFLRSHAAFKREFGGRPILLPTARHFAFNPFTRLLFHSLYPKLGGRKSIKVFMQRLRSG